MSISWERDGVKGGDSSSTIFLNWISLGSNYERWRGNTGHEKTKKLLCSEILEILKENGIYPCNIKGNFLCNSKPIFSFSLSCSPSTGIESITNKSEAQIFGASEQKVKHKATICIKMSDMC